MSRKLKRPVIDPKTFRKHSDLIREKTATLVVAGKRQPTSTGHIVQGTMCPQYETYFEVIAPSQVTAQVVHDESYKSIRVLAGRGVVHLYKGDKSRVVNLLPGEEIVLSPGISYSLGTDSKAPLELFVTQAAEYTETLRVLKESPTGVQVPEEGAVLDEITRSEAIRKNFAERIPQRRGSKAKYQQARIAIAKGHAEPMPEGPAVTENINAQPMADFSWDDAG